MLRLTWVDMAKRGRVLRVEGRIVDEWGAVLEEECVKSMASAVPGELDLSGTTHVDHRGFETLRSLSERGFRIVGENPLIAEIRRNGGW